MVFGLSCARAETQIVRMGGHGQFDRVSIPLPSASAFVSRRDGGSLIITSAAFGRLALVGVRGRRIRAIDVAPGRVSLAVGTTAALRIWRLGDRLVIDISDPPLAAGQRTPPRLHQSSGQALGTQGKQVRQAVPPLALPARPAREHVPAIPDGVARETAAVAGAAPAVMAAPLPPAGTERSSPLPDRLLARSAIVELRPPDGVYSGGSIVLPAGRDVGAAAFVRGQEASVVLDAALPLDLAALKGDAVFGATTVRLLQAATQLRFKLAAGNALRLRRGPEGWFVGAVSEAGRNEPGRDDAGRDGTGRDGAGDLQPIPIHQHEGSVIFGVNDAASVVVLDDPQSGESLLVGTERTGGHAVSSARRSPDFEVLATVQGVAVVARSDRLELRAAPAGFVLATGGHEALAAAWPGDARHAGIETVAMTRRFDLPDLPVGALRNRLVDALRDEAHAPPRARYAPRLRTAQAMLALGLDVEALAVLRVAEADEVPARRTGAGAALEQLAAWLAGRAASPGQAEAGAVMADGSDEGAFWNALTQAGPAGRPGQAAALATSWKVAVAYPAALRRKLLGPVADALLAGGQLDAASALLASSDSQALDLERGRLAELGGHTDEALGLLDRVAARPDRLQSALARREAIDARLAAHRIDAREAASRLQAQLDSWRGDGRELDVRLRLAALQQDAGEWRAALGLLRETEQLFPDAEERLHKAESALVVALLNGDAASRIAPLELVALVGEWAELLSKTDSAASLAPVLVDKLLALDLPDRAEPILVRMFDSSKAAGSKAELGLRLATLRLQRGDAAGAAQALGAEEPEGLPQPLALRRLLVRARMLEVAGDPAGALSLLAGSSAPDALEERAALLEKRRDWTGAEAVLKQLCDAALPTAGLFDDAQADLVLRFAGDAAQAGDMQAVQGLLDEDAKRFAPGARANLLRVLMQNPVRTVDDLPRAGQELATARELPATLAALQPR